MVFFETKQKYFVQTRDKYIAVFSSLHMKLTNKVLAVIVLFNRRRDILRKATCVQKTPAKDVCLEVELYK